MKTKLFGLALIGMFAIILAGCSTDETVKNEMQEKIVQTTMDNYLYTGPVPALMFRKSGKAVTKTIKFHEIEGPFELDDTVDGCAPFPYLTVSGTGNASHIGRYSVINQGCYDGQNPILGVITAANGDEIHTYIASAVQNFDTGIWYYHYVILNGTGRFLGAYGDIYLNGTLDYVNYIWNFSGEGEITY